MGELKTTRESQMRTKSCFDENKRQRRICEERAREDDKTGDQDMVRIELNSPVLAAGSGTTCRGEETVLAERGDADDAVPLSIEIT